MWRDEDGRVGTVTRTFTVRPGNYPVGRIRLSKLKDRLLTDGRVERDAAYLNDFYRAPTETHRLWRGPFLRPVEGIVTSVFGARRSYGRRPATTPHMGIDLGAPAGTPVLAANHGRVRFARWLESFGHTVLIDHGQGVFTYYLHMQNSEVAEGARVERGDPIGLVGQEGIATGPHLHWSLVVGGVRVDPAEWLETEIP
jgi:murein DD-endopeptidase MepM/ murein hydrolase activator NlpD